MAVDLYSNITVTNAISPVSPAATGTITGVVIDTSTYRSNTFIYNAGLQSANVTAVTPVVLEGTTTSALTSVAAANLIGAETSLGGVLTTGSVGKIGYIGKKRYVQIKLVVAGAATGVYSATLLQGEPMKNP